MVEFKEEKQLLEELVGVDEARDQVRWRGGWRDEDRNGVYREEG